VFIGAGTAPVGSIQSGLNGRARGSGRNNGSALRSVARDSTRNAGLRPVNRAGRLQNARPVLSLNERRKTRNASNQKVQGPNAFHYSAAAALACGGNLVPALGRN